MKTHTIANHTFLKKSVLELPIYSKLLKDYLQKEPALNGFYNSLPSSKDEWEKIINEKKNLSKADRELLSNILLRQYKEIETSDLVLQNIQKLKQENCYTVTTGHQLSIYTGPIFFIFKIVSVIAEAKQLKAWFPEYNFVPVFWMASEDHDFEEISTTQLFGKTIKIETTQAGAVGRMLVPADWATQIQAIKGLPAFVYEAYKEGESLSHATQKLVNELFKEQGLVILNPDERDLKQLMVPIFQKEIQEEFVYNAGVRQTELFEQAGYKAQIGFREINLFFLSDDFRERIIKNNDGSYGTLNGAKTWQSIDELLSEIEAMPEAFSPNVAMRPLYQERILPNLVYFGGPAELAYWLQFKTIFEEAGLEFPVVFPRMLGGYLSSKYVQKVNKTSLDIWDLFYPSKVIEEKILSLNNAESFNSLKAQEELEFIYNKLIQEVSAIDSTLFSFVDIKRKESKEFLLRIEKKAKKAILNKYAYQIERVNALKAVLMPNGGLQERSLNVFEILSTHSNFINELIEQAENYPLGMFHLMMEAEG